MSARDAHSEHSVNPKMQPASLTGRQQQLGLLMGRTQPDVLEAARVAALLNGQSSSFGLQSGLGGTAGLAGLGGAPSGLNLSLGSLPQPPQQAPQPAQLALPDQLALLSQFPHALFPQQYNSAADLQLAGLRNVGKTRSSDSRSSSAYASRHQAAEQRRRTRINERLELLRKLVPHAERANTACFLEEVIKYIEALKRRTLELEAMLEAATGKPVTKSLGLPGAAGGAHGAASLEPGADSQAPSPRHPASAVGQGAASSQQLASQQTAPTTAATTSSPLAPPGPTVSVVQQQQQEQLQPPQAPPQAPAPPPQLHLSSQAAAQLAQLLPSSQQPQHAIQQAVQQAGSQQSLLFPHSGGLSLGGGHLSLGTNVSSVSLAQLTAGLQAPHGLQHAAQGHLASHHHHHHMAQQLNELQTMHVMQSLQQSRATSHPSVFHPSNNKAFLHFNEDLFGGIKPELLPSRSLLGAAAASATPSTSLQLTTAQLPADSNTYLQVETTRKTLSGSPVSSEESGVPLKKRRVLLL